MKSCVFLTLAIWALSNHYPLHHTISTIVSILDAKSINARTIEPKVQSSTIFLGKGKEIEEDIDLDEEIVIPKWDIYNLSIDQKLIFGELLQKKAKR